MVKNYKGAFYKAADTLDVSEIKAAEKTYIDGGMSKKDADAKVKTAINSEYADAVDNEDWDRASKAIKTMRKLGYYVYDGKLKGSMRGVYSDYLMDDNTSKANQVLNEMDKRGMFSNDKYYTKKEYTVKQTNKTVGINKAAKMVYDGNMAGAKSLAAKYCNKYNFEYGAFWDRVKETASRLGKK
jgi:hypothetical protein